MTSFLYMNGRSISIDVIFVVFITALECFEYVLYGTLAKELLDLSHRTFVHMVVSIVLAVTAGWFSMSVTVVIPIYINISFISNISFLFSMWRSSPCWKRRGRRRSNRFHNGTPLWNPLIRLIHILSLVHLYLLLHF